MWAHLYTRSVGPPQDYVDLYLCRDVYHCTPSELKKQNAITVLRHLNIISVEQEVRELKKDKKHA